MGVLDINERSTFIRFKDYTSFILPKIEITLANGDRLNIPAIYKYIHHNLGRERETVYITALQEAIGNIPSNLPTEDQVEEAIKSVLDIPVGVTMVQYDGNLRYFLHPHGTTQPGLNYVTEYDGVPLHINFNLIDIQLKPWES